MSMNYSGDFISDTDGGKMRPSSSVMRNRLINGAMVIDQRNAGASGTGTGVYTVDRWSYQGSQTGKFTWGQNLGSVTPPVGFTNYLGFTSSSAYSVGASERFYLYQAIEGYNMADLQWGTANAKTITISAWVYSSLTGTFGGALQNLGGARNYPFSYTIPVANTWTQISFTVAGDTSGTWQSTNSGGIYVNFSLGAGATVSGTAGSWSGTTYLSATGATSVVGTNGATFYITGVQLEVGSSATGFEYRQYQQELALCQRYGFILANQSAGSSYIIASGQCFSTTNARVTATMPVTMRTAPTATISGSASNYQVYNAINSGPPALTAISLQGVCTTSSLVALDCTVAAGLVAGNATSLVGGQGSSYIFLSAEL